MTPRQFLKPSREPRLWSLSSHGARSVIMARVIEASRARGWSTLWGRGRPGLPRIEWGWAKLARRMGVTRAYVPAMLSGAKPPTASYAVRLARIFGWDVREVAEQLRDARLAWLETERVRAEDMARRDWLERAWESDITRPDDMNKERTFAWSEATQP